MKIVPPASFVPLGIRATPVSSESGPGPATLPFALLGGPGSAPAPHRPEAPASPSQPPQAGPATLAVQRDGDRITHVEVRCGCGTVHRIECSY